MCETSATENLAQGAVQYTSAPRVVMYKLAYQFIQCEVKQKIFINHLSF